MNTPARVQQHKDAPLARVRHRARMVDTAIEIQAALDYALETMNAARREARELAGMLDTLPLERRERRLAVVQDRRAS